MPRKKRDEQDKQEKHRTTVSFPKQVFGDLETAAKTRHLSSINDAIIDAVRQWLPVSPTLSDNQAARTAQEISTLAGGVSNPYQILAAQLRLERARKQLVAIKNQHLSLKGYDAEVYLDQVLNDVLLTLREGDCWFAITLLKFWLPIHSATARHHSFLETQKARVNEGLKVYRIFLLEEDDFRDSQKALREKVVEQHLDFEESCPKGSVATQYVRCPSAQPYPHWHFVAIRHCVLKNPMPTIPPDDKGCLVLEPQYDSGPSTSIPRLDFIFSHGNATGATDSETNGFLRSFFELSQQAKNIRELNAEPPAVVVPEAPPPSL